MNASKNVGRKRLGRLPISGGAVSGGGRLGGASVGQQSKEHGAGGKKPRFGSIARQISEKSCIW